jgi:hypothetical protein
MGVENARNIHERTDVVNDDRDHAVIQRGLMLGIRRVAEHDRRVMVLVCHADKNGIGRFEERRPERIDWGWARESPNQNPGQ